MNYFNFLLARSEAMLRAVIYAYARRPGWFVSGALVVMLLLALFITPFYRVFLSDDYYFLQTAFDLTQGNWQVVAHRLTGYPVFLSIFLKAFGISSFTDGMLLARWLNILCTVLCLFPYMRIAKHLLGLRGRLISLLLFAFFPPFYHYGTSGFSEALFLLLMLWAIAFSLQAKQKQTAWIWAYALASMAWQVKPNGLLLMLFLIGMHAWFVYRRDAKTTVLLVSLAVAVIIALPQFLLRTAMLGSAFSYGPNSAIFAEEYVQAWDPQYNAPSFLEFFHTYGWQGLYEKLIVGGLVKMFHMLGWLVSYRHLYIFLAGLAIILFNTKQRKPFAPLILLISLFFGSYLLVFDIFGAPRHFYPLVPFVFIIIAKTITYLSERFFKRPWRILALSLLLAVLLKSVPAFIDQAIACRGKNIAQPSTTDHWAEYLRSLEGAKMAMSHYSLYFSIGKEKKPDLYYFHNYPDMDSLINDFARQGIDYLVIVKQDLFHKRVLGLIPKCPFFRLDKSFYYPPCSGQSLDSVDVYRVMF